jgi:hypothetical protein
MLPERSLRVAYVLLVGAFPLLRPIALPVGSCTLQRFAKMRAAGKAGLRASW